MKIVTSVKDMQGWALQARKSGGTVGLVPTMGFLHAGHVSLIREARRRADKVVLSIFVNPTQFGPDEDLDEYPRDFERDEALCAAEGVDIVFYPPTSDMYAADASVFIVEEQLSRGLCGGSRPGHFRGVCTVVAKLFNLVLPDLAVFGRKDFQQLRILEQMTRDLNFPVEIVSAPIVREEDGLAISSRNKYLGPEERRQALCLREALDRAEELFFNGEREADAIKKEMRHIIGRNTLARIDYCQIVDIRQLQPLSTLECPALAALAVYIGQTRLIDNTVLE